MVSSNKNVVDATIALTQIRFDAEKFNDRGLLAPSVQVHFA